jgi:hypothetical protein
MLETKRIQRVNWEVTKSADIVFITNTDGAIGEAAGKLRDTTPAGRAIVLHCAARCLPRSYSRQKNAGHLSDPSSVQSFVSVEIGATLSGIIISVREPQAFERPVKIRSDLGATSWKSRRGKNTVSLLRGMASTYMVTPADLLSAE